MATEQDRPALRKFECDSGMDCASCGPEGKNAHEQDVQEYVRRLALDEAAHRAPHNDHALLVLHDPVGQLAGAIAFERTELVAEGRELDAVKLVVAGLRVDLQGSDVSGTRLSSHLLSAAIRGYDQTPPLVIARAAACNERSLSLLSRHGISMALTQTEPGYIDLVARAEDVLETLPDPFAE